MEDVFKILDSYGGLSIFAFLFVWGYIQDKKKSQNMLERIDKSNDNISKSIDAINSTTEVLKEYIINHDERAKKIDDNVEIIKEKLMK